MSISRAMMIHAAIHWPDMADTSVWAMAVSHAVFLWNHMPNPHTGLSPTDIFTRSRWKLSQLHNVHVWGSPVYILDKRISDGNKIPRWKPRSQRCISRCSPSGITIYQQLRSSALVFGFSQHAPSFVESPGFIR